MIQKVLFPALMCAATLSVHGASIHAGLLNYWPLDGDAADTSGSFAESSGATVDNGNVNGTTTFGAGLFGSAASLPGGAGNNITVADSAASSGGGLADDIDRTGSDMSLSVWINASAYTTGWQAIVSHGEQQDYRIARQASSNPVKFAGVAGTTDIVTASSYGSASPADGNWHHIVLTGINGGLASLYVDGILEGTSAALADPTVSIAQSNANNNVLCIGCNPDNGREFNGLIDDVAMWDRALSAGEVSDIFAAGQAGFSLGQIPEPGTGILGALAGAALVCARRRRATRS